MNPRTRRRWNCALLLVALSCGPAAFAQIAVSPSPIPLPAPDVAYNVTLSGSGGLDPFTYIATDGHLPTGLALDPIGTLSGTVPASSTFSYTIVAADANGRELDLTSSGATVGIALAAGNTTVFGELTSITATVTGMSPSGNVEFCADGLPADATFCASGTPLCASGSALSAATAMTSTATCQDASLSVGTHSVAAKYDGDAGNSATAASNAVTQTVDKDATTTTITSLNPPGPITAGSSVMVSVLVAANAPGAGTPSGNVAIDDGAGATCQVTLVNAAGSCALTPAASGSKSITAQYGGDGSFLTSTSVSVPLSVTPPAHTVTAAAGANGNITPALQYVVDGNKASFTVTPAAGFTPNIGGTCPAGTFSSGTYFTGPIMADCTVMVTFASATAALNLLVTDNHAYARYGMALDYIVTASNSAGADVTGLTISGDASSDLDASSGHWLCLASNSQCVTQGQGPFTDSSVTVPANGSVNWIVTVPVFANAPNATADYTVTLDGPSFSGPITQTDGDVLVIYRDGFDVPLADGAQSIAPSISAAMTNWDGDAMLAFHLPPPTANAMIEAVLSASAVDGSAFGVERVAGADRIWLRVVVRRAHGTERVSDWTAVAPNARLILGTAAIGNERMLLLIGAEREIELPLGGASTLWRLQSPAGTAVVGD